MMHKLRFVNPIIFVENMDISLSFYRDVLGLRTVEVDSNFVRFDNGFAIHEGGSLARTVWGSSDDQPAWFGCRNLLLYFEHDAVDELFDRTKQLLDLIHPVQEQPWGQRVFRFYDPDRHAIEVGEPYQPGIEGALTFQDKGSPVSETAPPQIS